MCRHFILEHSYEETSPRLCMWQCPSATKFSQPLTVDSCVLAGWQQGNSPTQLTPRLQVAAQSWLAILPIFLIQYETKIPTLLMTWNKIVQRAYLEQRTCTPFFPAQAELDTSVLQGPGYPQQFSRRVVQTPQKLRNINYRNHSIPNPIHISMNSPLWCKLLIVSMYGVHLSWKILSKYFTESTSLWK